jgi:ribonuclease HII
LNLIFQNPLESGTDEAGRGCLAGPVTAAVILPADFKNNSE